MAKTQKPDEEEEGDAKSGGKLKFIIIGVVALALVYQFVLKKPAPADPAATGASTTIAEGQVLPVPELTVDLADQDQLHYLKVGLALVLEKGVTPGAIEPEIAKASDVAITLLRSKTYAELRQPGATAVVKDELSAKIREAFDNKKIVRVIFTSFVMQ